MNFDGLSSLGLRNVTTYVLATAGAKVAKKRGQSKGRVGLHARPLFCCRTLASGDMLLDLHSKFTSDSPPVNLSATTSKDECHRLDHRLDPCSGCNRVFRTRPVVPSSKT